MFLADFCSNYSLDHTQSEQNSNKLKQHLTHALHHTQTHTDTLSAPFCWVGTLESGRGRGSQAEHTDDMLRVKRYALDRRVLHTAGRTERETSRIASRAVHRRQQHHHRAAAVPPAVPDFPPAILITCATLVKSTAVEQMDTLLLFFCSVIGDVREKVQLFPPPSAGLMQF